MLAFIKGNLVSEGINNVIVENNGIGYDINVSATTINKLHEQGNPVQIVTYLHVKEDGIVLYGFYSKEEKEVFLKLISVSGIGPKIAIQLLSGISVADLKTAIVTGDPSYFSKIKGIGKKTAERIVLELKGQMDDFGPVMVPVANKSGAFEETVMALMALGFTQSESLAAVSKVKEDGLTAEKMLSLALKNINR